MTVESEDYKGYSIEYVNCSSCYLFKIVNKSFEYYGEIATGVAPTLSSAQNQAKLEIEYLLKIC